MSAQWHQRPASAMRQPPVAARLLVLWSLGFIVCGCGLGFFFCTRKNRKEETKHTMNHYSDNLQRR
jgi:cytochrome c-type biogenesis protein CcmH/NrfF